MHEQEKLGEAKYFLQHMEASLYDRVAFKYELSAFLSAARSVLQYACKEAVKKPNGRKWYEAEVSGNSVLKFFKDKRDINIHAEPVRATRQISVCITEQIGISDSIRIEIQNKDGTAEVRQHKEEPPQANPQDGTAETKIRYVFRDWRGSEDVIDLARQYIAALEDFVKAGFSNGIISG